MLLIWDFKIEETISVTTEENYIRATKENEVANRFPCMPLLDLTKVDCNCSSLPRNEKVILANESQTLDRELQNLTLAGDATSEEEEEQFVEEQEDSKSDGEEEEFDFNADFKAMFNNTEEFLLVADSVASSIKDTLFTEKFTLKGSSFHEHLQVGLKMCKEALIKKDVVPLKLVYDPTNRRDGNAIVVQAKHDTWRPIHYIPKVPKITHAIRGRNC